VDPVAINLRQVTGRAVMHEEEHMGVAHILYVYEDGLSCYDQQKKLKRRLERP
jgi:hypothetical protein